MNDEGPQRSHLSYKAVFPLGSPPGNEGLFGIQCSLSTDREQQGRSAAAVTLGQFHCEQSQQLLRC